MIQQLSLQQLSIEKQCEKDERLRPIAQGLQAALIQIEESCSDLRSYADSLDNDPNTLAALDERMAAYHSAARKHRLEPEALEAHHQSLLQEHASLTDSESSLEALSAQVDNLRADYQRHADSLHEQRLTVAERLSQLISDAMQGLSMQGGKISIALTQNKDQTHPLGQDDVEFLVSANPGQPLKPLSKVASGGELSRISLAIQMITAQCEPVPTLIFDEVDSGVGGAVAELVGRSLRSLSQQRQVLCVTHLPQVACQADHQLKVQKVKESDNTRTGIRTLNDTERTEEIARMLGGVDITENTRAHAQEMLSRRA